MTHEAGKGDTQRPTNHDKFSSNYDNIFRKKEKGATPISEMPQDFQDAIRKGLADGALTPTGETK